MRYKITQKFKYTTLFAVVMPYYLVVHKQVQHISLLQAFRYPMRIFLRSKRIFTPIPIRKTNRYIITQFTVFKQQAQAIVYCIFIYKIRTLPPKYVFCTISKHRLKAQFRHTLTYLIRVYKRCISEGNRFLPKELFYSRSVAFYLLFKLISIFR